MDSFRCLTRRHPEKLADCGIHVVKGCVAPTAMSLGLAFGFLHVVVVGVFFVFVFCL